MKVAKEYRLTNFVMKKDFISLLNCIFGLYSIFFALQGDFTRAAILMVLAVVADILDGKYARLMGQSNEFGKRMDMADLVSFGVAPAIFILSKYSATGTVEIFLHLSAIFLLSAVLFRLARFQKKSSDVGGFVGVPSTTAGLFYPALYFIGLGTLPVIVLTFIISILMMCTIVIPIK